MDKKLFENESDELSLALDLMPIRIRKMLSDGNLHKNLSKVEVGRNGRMAVTLYVNRDMFDALTDLSESLYGNLNHRSKVVELLISRLYVEYIRIEEEIKTEIEQKNENERKARIKTTVTKNIDELDFRKKRKMTQEEQDKMFSRKYDPSKSAEGEVKDGNE